MRVKSRKTCVRLISRRRVLLDTGDGKQPEYFLNLKKSLNFDKITLRDIIISHWHHDHVGGVSEVLKSAEVRQCQLNELPF